MTKQEIARTINMIAYTKVGSEQKSPIEAQQEAKQIVESVLVCSKELAEQYDVSPMNTFQLMMSQIQYFLSNGVSHEKAVNDSKALVENTFIMAQDLEEKYR